jgi:uridine monophosphate synthetase
MGGNMQIHLRTRDAGQTANPSFFDRLEARALAIDSLLCVGLDAHPSLLESPGPEGAFAFCRRMIEATADAACAFKVNSAFFESLGAEGVAALRQVIASIPEEIPVILDAKRGDIGSTAQAYAKAAFGVLGADAVTVSPYLGRDALQPFLQDETRGAFVLVKTTNPGANEFQALVVGSGEPLYVHLARRVAAWPEAERVGLVVGATDPQAVGRVRSVARGTWLLCPGVGAQGGDLDATLEAGLRPDGMGVLVAVSRSLAQADDPEQAAQELRRRINVARDRLKARGSVAQTSQPDLSEALVRHGCVQFGEFVLKSGASSPIYIDLRRLASHPDVLAEVANAFLPVLDGLAFDCLAGIPYAGLPIATALSLLSGRPAIYPRKETKAYGLRAGVEGEFQAGQEAVVIDDLASSGESKLEAIRRLEGNGLIVQDVVVLIDRQGGARAELARQGYSLHAVLKLNALVETWRAGGWIDDRQAAAVLAGIID